MKQRTHIKLKAPAKLNIFLKVTGRRPDGYHDLVSIMIPVSFFDSLTIRVTEKQGIALECPGSDLPCDDKNLVYRAAGAVLQETGIKRGVRLILEKNIPVAAGLGGGSSDAAATLLGLNRILGTPLSENDLHGLAAQLGADVPFFLVCRPALARGIGEILEPLGKWPKLWYVIITPDIRVSTAWVYSNLKIELTRSEYLYIFGLLNCDPLPVHKLLKNNLETVACARFPIIEEIKKRLLKTGAKGVLMSGSGPSVFGVFDRPGVAERAINILAGLDLGKVVLAESWERKKSSHAIRE